MENIEDETPELNEQLNLDLDIDNDFVSSDEAENQFPKNVTEGDELDVSEDDEDSVQDDDLELADFDDLDSDVDESDLRALDGLDQDDTQTMS